jgi:hypothetical protein
MALMGYIVLPEGGVEEDASCTDCGLLVSSFSPHLIVQGMFDVVLETGLRGCTYAKSSAG